jgi:hypothetical protein
VTLTWCLIPRRESRLSIAILTCGIIGIGRQSAKRDTDAHANVATTGRVHERIITYTVVRLKEVVCGRALLYRRQASTRHTVAALPRWEPETVTMQLGSLKQ